MSPPTNQELCELLLAVAEQYPAPAPVVALEEFTAEYDGETITITEGERFHENEDGPHEIVAKYPEKFRALTTDDSTAGVTLGQLYTLGGRGYVVAVLNRRTRPQAPVRRQRRTVLVVRARARSRQSHATHAGHRRTQATRAGPSSDDDPPAERWESFAAIDRIMRSNRGLA